jgi:hypothetical protein
MKTVTTYERIASRLTELQNESERIINTYIDLAAISPYAEVMKDLQNKLKAVRKEQFELFDRMKIAA